MADNNNKISQLETFAQILYGVKFCRFIFFFYSFLCFIFWFLNCLEVEWLYIFDWLFIIPYKLVSNFYTPQGVSVDFSLAIIGTITLFAGLGFNFFVEKLYKNIVDMQEAEERRIKERRMKQQQKKRAAAAAAAAAAARTQMGGVPGEVQSVPQPFENSKLIFLILPHTNKIKRKKEDLELTFQEVEIWKQRVNKKLIENISFSKPMQKGYYRKNLFLVYKDFNFCDDFIYYLSPTLDSIILEFKKYGISVSFCYVLSSLTDLQGLEKELDCMDTIISLNFVNEIIVTNRFKVTYDNKAIHKYDLHLKGEYNLSKNLTVTNRQPLFTITDKKKEEIKQ